MPKWLLTVSELAANGKLNKMPSEKLIFHQNFPHIPGVCHWGNPKCDLKKQAAVKKIQRGAVGGEKFLC